MYTDSSIYIIYLKNEGITYFLAIIISDWLFHTVKKILYNALLFSTKVNSQIVTSEVF